MPEAWLHALLGGLCIGAASVGLMAGIGRIAGISGIGYTALVAPRGNPWAITFLVGLVAGAAIHRLLGAAPPAFDVPLPLLVAGGLLVGIGTKLGSGCTSGHGICGIGRLSTRSIVATCTFMAFGMLTVVLRALVSN